MARLNKSTRKILVSIVGFPTILIGIILLALPGPGIVVIILGLVVLATEFEWAKNYLNKAKEIQRKAAAKARARKSHSNKENMD